MSCANSKSPSCAPHARTSTSKDQPRCTASPPLELSGRPSATKKNHSTSVTAIATSAATRPSCVIRSRSPGHYHRHVASMPSKASQPELEADAREALAANRSRGDGTTDTLSGHAPSFRRRGQHRAQRWWSTCRQHQRGEPDDQTSIRLGDEERAEHLPVRATQRRHRLRRPARARSARRAAPPWGAPCRARPPSGRARATSAAGRARRGGHGPRGSAHGGRDAAPGTARSARGRAPCAPPFPSPARGTGYRTDYQERQPFPGRRATLRHEVTQSRGANPKP